MTTPTQSEDLRAVLEHWKGSKYAWTTEDELVGDEVQIRTAYLDEEPATVLAVSTTTTNIMVRAHEDGEILIGNSWDW